MFGQFYQLTSSVKWSVGCMHFQSAVRCVISCRTAPHASHYIITAVWPSGAVPALAIVMLRHPRTHACNATLSVEAQVVVNGCVNSAGSGCLGLPLLACSLLHVSHGPGSGYSGWHRNYELTTYRESSKAKWWNRMIY